MFGNWTRWDKDSLKKVVKTSLYVDEEAYNLLKTKNEED